MVGVMVRIVAPARHGSGLCRSTWRNLLLAKNSLKVLPLAGCPFCGAALTRALNLRAWTSCGFESSLQGLLPASYFLWL
jgi:hypothetical protein